MSREVPGSPHDRVHDMHLGGEKRQGPFIRLLILASLASAVRDGGRKTWSLGTSRIFLPCVFLFWAKVEAIATWVRKNVFT